MRKRVLAFILLGCLALAACGKADKKEENSESSSADIMDDVDAEGNPDAGEEEVLEDKTPITKDTIADKGIDAFMTLGEYKGVELTKTLYTVTDEDISAQIKMELQSAPMEVTDPEATVAENDVVNMDYEGKVDGEVFEGGTAKGDELVIGSGRFIDGFEDQLVGWKKGQTGDINVTFPEDYDSEDLKGKDAVFTVTINKISRTAEEPTEEWLAANRDSVSLEDYRAGVKTSLEENNAATTQNNLMDDAWGGIFTTAKFTQYPQDVLDECMKQQKSTYESYAAMYGMEYDDFVESAGIKEEDLTLAAKNSVQNVLAMEYISEKEGITPESEAYKTKLDSLLKESGFDSKEAAIEGGVSEWNIDFVTKYNCVMDFIIENAKITETTDTAEDTDAPEDADKAE